MASAAEQLASNLNFAAFGRAEELKKRIWFTLGALLIYRLGTYIPLPGIDLEALAQAFQRAALSSAWPFSRSASCRTSRLPSSFS
mgnify:CR=1 FL=1